MRITILLLSAMLLAGCSLLSDPRPYDNVEYLLITKVTVESTRAIHMCSDPTHKNTVLWEHVDEVNANSLVLDEFLANKNDSLSQKQTVTNIRLMVNNLLVRGNFSKAYCVEKLTNIQASSRIVARSMGQSDHAACDGGIQDRYTIFAKSFAEKEISASEFKELVNDVDRLTNVDTKGCDADTLRKHQEDVQLMEKVVPMIMSL